MNKKQIIEEIIGGIAFMVLMFTIIFGGSLISFIL